MVKIARALDTELRCHLQPDGAISTWFDMYKAEKEETINLAEELKNYSDVDCSEITECQNDNVALTA